MPDNTLLTSSAVSKSERKLAAIMFTDIVGFSRQMGADEARMLRLLDVHNQLIQQAVAEHHGTVIKTVGDAFLVDFPSVVHAVQGAQSIQAQLRTHNAEKAKDEQIHVRIGIHSGDIVQKDGDVFGDGVNIASRLQTLAEPDTICISDVVYRDVAKKLDLGTVVALGRPQLKNIAERFQVYALLPEQPKGFLQKLQVQRLKLSRRVRPVQRMALAGLLLIAATFATVRYLPFPGPTTQSPIPNPQSLLLPDKPSIVVLPFINLSNDPEQEYFSDGLTEDLTSALSKLSGLFVISRNSAFSYKGKTVKIQEISKEMGVRYVMEGSVRRADNHVRITAQLIDATTDHHLWSERYDRPLKDIFALQDEIVQKIVTTLKLQLTVWEQGSQARKTTDNLEAYDYYLRGMDPFSRAPYEMRKELNEQARQMFEKAVTLDPTYAEAYARLGWTYFNGVFYGWDSNPAQSSARAEELAHQALALDNFLPGPHTFLGWVTIWKKQYEQAIAEGERATILDPNAAEGYVWLGIILAFAGRPEEAIGEIEKAIRLNPRYPPMYPQSLGFAYRMAGRCTEAIAPLQRSLALVPNFLPARFNLALCYAELDREEEAQAEMAEVKRLSPHASLEGLKRDLPYKDPVVLERTFAAARKAGLK